MNNIETSSIMPLAYKFKQITIGTKIDYTYLKELREFIILAYFIENKNNMFSGDFEDMFNFIEYIDNAKCDISTPIVIQCINIADGKNKRAFIVIRTDEEISIIQTAVLLYLKRKGDELNEKQKREEK